HPHYLGLNTENPRTPLEAPQLGIPKVAEVGSGSRRTQCLPRALGDCDAARRDMGLQPGHEVHSVAEDLGTALEYLAHVHGDAKRDRQRVVYLRAFQSGAHALLNAARPNDGVVRLREFNRIPSPAT